MGWVIRGVVVIVEEAIVLERLVVVFPEELLGPT